MGPKTPGSDFNRQYFTWRIGASTQKKRRRRTKAGHPPEEHLHGVALESSDIQEQPMSMYKSLSTLRFKLDDSFGPALNFLYLDILPSFYINFQSRSSDPRHSYLQDVSPFVTEDAVAFHGTMVVAQICQESLRYRSHAVGYRSRFLLQKTLESLRVALGNGKESLGAAAWGIQALISYYAMFGDFDQAALHARALKTLVAQNGGYGALGLFGGFHAQGVFSYLELFDSWETIRAKIQAEADFFGSTTYYYPTAPARPDMGRWLGDVPPGFARLGLAGAVSGRAIVIVGRIARWRGRSSDTPSANPIARIKQNRLNAALCIWTLTKGSTSWEENLCLVASLTYCIFVSEELELWYVYRCYVQLCCGVLNQFPVDTSSPDLLLWTAAMLTAVCGPGTLSASFADRLGRHVRRDHADHVFQPRDLDSFFWDASLSDMYKLNMNPDAQERASRNNRLE